MTIINPASQAIAALLVGLLTSFTCQLLLTNLGVALGITVWGGPPKNKDGSSNAKSTDDTSELAPIGIGTISVAAGFGLLLTVNSIMFVACYVAVKFCAPTTALNGAILGWIVWSAYALIITWISTRAANSLVAFLFSSAVSGLRQIFSVFSSLVRSAFDDQDTPLTSNAAAKLVQQETQLALDQIDIPALIEEYIDEQLPPQRSPQMPIETVRPQLETTLQQANLETVEQQGLLSKVDFNTFIQWVKDEMGLSGNVADSMASILSEVWEKVVSSDKSPRQQLEDVFSTALIDDFIPERISQLVERLQQDSSHSSEVSFMADSQPSVHSHGAEGAEATTLTNGLSRQLKRILRQRLDLADVDVQTIWDRVGPLLPDWSSAEGTSFNTQIIHEDVDDYLQQVFPWRLNNTTLRQEFYHVLVDPDADSVPVLRQLQALGPQDFTHSLKQRGDLDAKQVDALVNELEAVRQSAIAHLMTSTTAAQDDPLASESETDQDNQENQTDSSSAEEEQAIAELQQKLEDYLHYTSLSQIDADAIAQKVETLVEDSPVDPENLHQASPHLPADPLIEVLNSRRGLDSTDRDQLVHQVQAAWKSSTTDDDATTQASEVGFSKYPRRFVLRCSAEVGNFWDNVTEYFKHSPPDQLTPAAVQHNLTWLWQASGQSLDALPNVQHLPSISSLSHHLPFSDNGLETVDTSTINWSYLGDALSHRQDLTVDQVEEIWLALEQFIQSLMHQANQARQQVQAFLESWLASVKTILNDSAQQMFEPADLKANLRELLQQPSDIFATLIQPLNLRDAAEDTAAAIAQLSQDALQQILIAQGVPKVVLAQAKGLKEWMQTRLSAMAQDLRHQQTLLTQSAARRIEDARKALAIAAWWLFAIAVTSGTTATVSGALAVTGLDTIWQGIEVLWSS